VETDPEKPQPPVVPPVDPIDPDPAWLLVNITVDPWKYVVTGTILGD